MSNAQDFSRTMQFSEQTTIAVVESQFHHWGVGSGAIEKRRAQWRNAGIALRRGNEHMVREEILGALPQAAYLFVRETIDLVEDIERVASLSTKFGEYFVDDVALLVPQVV